MIKNFIELSKVEVPITKKPTFKYNKAKQEFEEVKGKDLDTISWVDCLNCLYANGAESVVFDNIPKENGELLYIDENGCIHIRVFVEIDGVRREIFYPVIDGSRDVKLDKLTQSDIYNAKQRAFVKCVAVNWGLGINIWKKSDAEENIDKTDTTYSVFENFRSMVNNATKKLGGVPQLLEHLNGQTEKSIKQLVEAAAKIDGITKVLEKVLSNDKESE